MVAWTQALKRANFEEIMKKRAKPAVKKPPTAAKRRVVRSPAKPSPGKTERAAGEAGAPRDKLAAALAELVAISADMRELLMEIRDLLAEGMEEAEEEPEAGDTVVIAETEGEEFE